MKSPFEPRVGVSIFDNWERSKFGGSCVNFRRSSLNTWWIMEASDHQTAFWGPLTAPTVDSWERAELGIEGNNVGYSLSIVIVKKCGVASRTGNVWWSNVGDHVAILAELDERWECVKGDGVAVLDNLR
jgi:hypothetical protein